MGAGFCSLYQEIHYFEVCYIEVWVYMVSLVNYHLLRTYIQFTYDKPCICLRSFNSIKCFFTITWAITTRSINQFCIVQRTFWIQSPEFICEKSCVYQIDSLSLKNTHLCPCGLAQGQIWFVFKVFFWLPVYVAKHNHWVWLQVVSAQSKCPKWVTFPQTSPNSGK